MEKIIYKTLDLNGFWNKEEEIGIKIEMIIPRFKLKKILNRLNEKYIEIITGPRQTGKTTLLYLILNELQRRNKNYKNLFYVNLDTIINYEIFENPVLFYENIKNSFEKRSKINYLFIDEIQRLKNPGRFLKGLYDLGKNLKIIVSGSSFLEIKSKTKEFLTGRKRETNLLPISFQELVDFEDKIPADLGSKKITQKSLKFWEDNEKIYGKYLMDKMVSMAQYGGYPAVLTKNTKEQKIEELSELFHSYVRKDIVDFMKIERVDIYNALVKVMATQIGNLMNYTELSSLVRGNLLTVSKYLNILEGTFVIYQLRPFTSQRRNEVKHARKCFFIDNGLRNFVLLQFNAFDMRSDSGVLLENLCLNEILKKKGLQEEVFYWRTKSGAEIDIVIKKEGQIIPVEIKSGSATVGTLTKSFYSFINFFSPEKGIFINRDKFGMIKVNKTKIYYIPAKWFLLYGLNLI